MSDLEKQQSDESGAGGDLASQLSGGGDTEFVVAEEKKSPAQGLIFLLVLLAVGGGGTYFMYMRQGPAAAQAAANPEAQKAEQTINTFLTSGPDGIKMMQTMLKDTEKVVQQFLEYPSLTQIPLSSLHTNPFRMAAANGADGEPVNLNEEALKRKREEEKQAAIKACDALKLQSIISGSRKACMINNTLYQEGQQVEQSGIEFTVEKIEPSRVIVKTGTFRFELKSRR